MQNKKLYRHFSLIAGASIAKTRELKASSYSYSAAGGTRTRTRVSLPIEYEYRFTEFEYDFNTIETGDQREVSLLPQGGSLLKATLTLAILFAMSSLSLHAQSESEPARKTVSVESAILKTIESTALASQVAGMIQVLDVREGKKLTKGQEVGRVRDTAVRLQMEKARLSVDLSRKKQDNDIDLKLAAKNSAVAENEYKRATEANLKVSNVYPINEIDRLRLLFDRTTLESERAAYQKSVAAMESSIAELEYKQSQELLERHQIVSPCDGVVTSVEKRVGEWVDPGSVLFTIVQIDRLRIEGFVNASDISPDWIGKQATVRIQNPNLERKAELVFISPDANPVNSQVRVFLEIDNSDGVLRPGIRPTVILDSHP